MKQLMHEFAVYSILCLHGVTSLFFQSRLYLGLGRDGLLPSIFAKVHHIRHTPIRSQIWVGCVAGILAGLFNVHELSHILSVGTLVSFLASFNFNIFT